MQLSTRVASEGDIYMKCLWHIRTMPDFHWILPYVYYSSSYYKVFISFEDNKLADLVEENIRVLCPDMEYEIVCFNEISGMSFDIGIFEWGIGCLSSVRYFLKRFVIRDLDGYVLRSRILRAGIVKKAYCLPHGYNVKYGRNLKNLGPIGKLKRYFSNTNDRLIFDAYYFDNHFHREVYSTSKLHNKSKVIDPMLLRREWLDRYPENLKFTDLGLFFVPKLNNRINIPALTDRVRLLAEDPHIFFVIHPREVDSHNAYLSSIGLEKSRVVDLQGDIVPALKVCKEVYDIGSSIAMLCIALKKPYVLERFTENTSFLDDFSCGTIDSVSSEYLYKCMVAKNTNFSQVSDSLKQGAYFGR